MSPSGNNNNHNNNGSGGSQTWIIGVSAAGGVLLLVILAVFVGYRRSKKDAVGRPGSGAVRFGDYMEIYNLELRGVAGNVEMEGRMKAMQQVERNANNGSNNSNRHVL